MINKIVFCTLRDNKGATGGPGGVLFLQQTVLGKELLGYKCEYWFNPFHIKRDILRLNRIGMAIKMFFARNTYFITHEVSCANLLARLNKPYSLIFHNQGPLVEEYKNFGANQDSKMINRIAAKERIAFINANTLHFPSIGAIDMYFDSQYASCNRKEVNIGKPLFNIILPKPVKEPESFEFKKEPDMLTFFSLGTLTTAKGQDQAVKFIGEFLKFYPGKTRYIIVGKGPMKDALDNDLMKLVEKYTSFSYRIIDAMPHDQVMYLHQLADVYIMLHRISIFDFATLEAMSQSSAIVLSKVGGNLDFDKEKNILFAEDYQGHMEDFAKTDFEALKTKNKAIFDKYFSISAFMEQYISFVDTIVRPLNNR